MDQPTAGRPPRARRSTRRGLRLVGPGLGSDNRAAPSPKGQRLAASGMKGLRRREPRAAMGRTTLPDEETDTD
jgi:hypothetical protein